MSIAIQNPWLRTDAAADHIDSEPSTLAKWRQLGKGPPYSCSTGHPRYRLSDLDAFMAANIAANTTEAKSLRRQARLRRLK